MAAINYLFSTLLMGLSLLVIGWTLTRIRPWQRYSPAGTGAPGYVFPATTGGESLLVRTARSPTIWIVGFVLLALGFGAGTLVFIAGSTFPDGVARTAGLALGGLTALLLLFFLFLGVYRSARGRGLGSSQAAAVSAWVFGALLLAAIATKLLTAS